MGRTMRAQSVIFQTSQPSLAEIEELLDFGIQRFVFLGPNASTWANGFVDAMALRRATGRPVLDAQSMILQDESLFETIELIRGLADEEEPSGILVL